MTRRYYSSRHVGRVRVRLSEILAEHGYVVAPDDLRPQTGAWRTDCRLDVCRWEATLTDVTGCDWLVQCWDTMTECVRRGVDIRPDTRSAGYLIVSARSEQREGGA